MIQESLNQQRRTGGQDKKRNHQQLTFGGERSKTNIREPGGELGGAKQVGTITEFEEMGRNRFRVQTKGPTVTGKEEIRKQQRETMPNREQWGTVTKVRVQLGSFKNKKKKKKKKTRLKHDNAPP